jgi:hypothetical protein
MGITQKLGNAVLKKPLDLFGESMKKTSMKFQFESALASYGLILLSLIFLFGYQVYNAIFTSNIGWSIFYAINALCGIFIMYGQLVQTFMSYLQITAASEMADALENIIAKKVENKEGEDYP